MKIHTFRTSIVLVLFFASVLAGTAQKQANFWYFGFNAGLDFTNGDPVPVYDGQIHTNEGCATISDFEGNLLFYTDGTTIWNKQHKVMSNGTGLNGNFSSTQSAIIVPKPYDPQMYYVFTVDTTAGANGLQYSEVDMSLDNGLGSVTIKNTFLVGPVCEKLTAVRNENRDDIWIIVHGWGNNQFMAFPVTSAGVSPFFISSAAGTVIDGARGNTIGYMKASPDGKFLALAHLNLNKVELVSFDAASGEAGTATTLIRDSSTMDSTFGGQGAYGLEFSEGSRFLYVGETGDSSKIYQFDLQAGNVETSGKVIGQMDTSAALQLGPNGKIYVVERFADSLAAINSPDSLGLLCDFNRNAVQFDSGFTARFGLPTFLPYFFNCNLAGKADLGEDVFECNVDSVVLYAGISNAKYSWNNGIFQADSSWTVYPVSTVTVIVDSAGCISSDTASVRIDEMDTFDLGNDTILCFDDGESLLLRPGIYSFNANYSWQDGSDRAFFEATEPGTYSVWVHYYGCSQTDTIELIAGCEPIIPNIITPNKDNTNDVFYISNLPENADLTVYNRWGKRVFKQPGYTNDWNGNNVSEGMYYYELSVFGKDKPYKGWLRIER